nr:ribonuclease H-like domain-containing protein [Tanacetum cinerariifolium]
MNYSSWVYYFSHLCHVYGILDHLVDLVASLSTATPMDPPPKDAEWTKIDFIIRSWIFSTLAPSLRKHLVDLNPTTAKDAWTYIAAYIVSILNCLGSPLSNDDVVTFALEGLPSTYKKISIVIVSREPFLDLKTVRSLLTTHEMRQKSRIQNPLVDATFASPMVLLTKSNTNAWRGPSLEKVNNPCWSFIKGSCLFGDACNYLHNDVHDKSTLLPRTSGSASSVPDVTRSDLDIMQSLLAKFGLNTPNTSTPLLQSLIRFMSLLWGSVSDGVTTARGLLSTAGGSASSPPQGVHLVPGPSQPPVQFTWLFVSGSQGLGQATLLPNAFNTTTLQDPAFGSWNMDTSASSYLNDSVHCLSDILNMCIYPCIAVGDGRFILVTNSGHSILSTPFRPPHLNNVLITPNIVKNLIFICQFVRDNSCTVEFDPFGFSVKDFITRRVLLRCVSTGDLYPVMKPSTIPHAFLTSQYTWHQRLRHPGSEVLRRLVSSDSISCNKEKLPVLCHACKLGKHLKLPIVSYSSVTSCFDIVHSDLWTSPILSLSAPVHTPQVDVPTPPTRPPPHTPQSMPQIVPKHAPAPTNDSLTVSIHPMVTRSRVGTTRPNPRYASHVEGVDIDETFSLVVKPCTIWTVLSLAISQHWPIHQLNVKNAFLHGDLAETVYMHQPPSFWDLEHPNYVCLLLRSLYGLKQAPRAWSAVCLYLHDPYEPHFSALKRNLRYVQGTSDYGLHLFSSTTDSLIAYLDADWAGCPTTRRSTLGYFVFLGNNLLSWASKRQLKLSRSSAEVGYRSVANAVDETCWIYNLLRELHTPLSSATIVYCDNVSAVYLSSNPVQHQRTKHIEIDIHFVWDLVATGQVHVLHVPSWF